MKAGRIKISSFLFILVSAGFFSCDMNRVYEQNVDIPGQSWNRDSTLFFNVDIEDTLSAHSILLNIRHNSNYPKQNLYLFINTVAPSGFSIRDTFELMLANEKGIWYGSGLGDIYDFQAPFKQNVRFPHAGTYRFELEQAMRYNLLPEIRTVGLRIERINN